MNKRRLFQCVCAAICTLLLQIIYSHMFGQTNALIGVIMGISIYLFLKMDFTLNIEYRIVTFLIIAVFLGVMSYVAMLNPWMGLMVNIITIFIISFTYVSDFTSTISYCFLLMYVFMCAYPVKLSQLKDRLFSLAFGVLLIGISQLIFNRNKFKKVSKKIIIEIICNIQEDIKNSLCNNYKLKDNSIIDEKLRTLLTLIDERNNKKFFSLKEDRIYFSVAIALERLNLIINEVNECKADKKIKEQYLTDLSLELDNVSYLIKNFKKVKKASKGFNHFINKYKSKANKYEFVYESIEVLEVFNFTINNLDKSIDKNLIRLGSRYSFINEFIPISFVNKFLDVKSLKFSYSLKLAFAVSVVMFLVDILNVPNGKWIVATTYVIMQPYSENTVVKAKRRIKGTLIGVILFFIGANFFLSIVPKILIMLFVLTIFFYVKEYYLKVICTCIISLSVATTGGNLIEMSFSRCICVILGILISLFFDKFFLPYNLSKSIEDLKNKYIKLTNYMIYEVKDIFNHKKDEKRLLKLVLYCNLIESKLLSNISKDNDDKVKSFLNEQKIIISDIRFLLLGIYCINDKKYLKKSKFNELLLNRLLQKVNRELIC